MKKVRATFINSRRSKSEVNRVSGGVPIKRGGGVVHHLQCRATGRLVLCLSDKLLAPTTQIRRRGTS